MPIVRIHVLDGRYDERRLGNVSRAVQDALESILKIPSDDFYQVIHELPRNRFLHTPSFVGMKYSQQFPAVGFSLEKRLVFICYFATPSRIMLTWTSCLTIWAEGLASHGSCSR
jgi:hypothetical protein